MTKERVKERYFHWMERCVRDDRMTGGQSYDLLLRRLFAIPFTYTIPLDGNREADGIDLRYWFGEEEGYSDAEVAAYLDDRPCSVLEMMVSLAKRIESHIMADPDIGDRTGRWFWEMVFNLGLGGMGDGYFDEEFVDEKIDIFLRREYEADGRGGLFTVENAGRDLRSVEIWYQMCWHMNDILN